jgi:hypothetical protein
MGREVKTLVNENQSTGSYDVVIDATELPSGTYFYNMTAVNPSASSGQAFSETKKMIVLK